jgi:hypothetical protein
MLCHKAKSSLGHEPSLSSSSLVSAARFVSDAPLYVCVVCVVCVAREGERYASCGDAFLSPQP